MITRREFVRGAGATGAFALAGGGLLAACTPPPPGGPPFNVPPGNGPNLLMISIEGLNDYVGFLGGYAGDAHTPNIDALAAGGRSFLHAQSAAALSLPSRAAALWSLSPGTTNITSTSTGDINRYAALVADPSKLTLPQVLADDGYHTVNTGIVFETAIPSMWHTTHPYPELYHVHEPVGPDRFAYRPSAPGETHADQDTADWIAGRLAASYDRPFFIAAGFYQPHVPWVVPQWAFDLHPLDGVVLPDAPADDLDDVPPPGVALADAPLFNHAAVVSAGTQKQVLQAYLAAMSHTDAMVGQVLDALANSPFADDTYVVLWSDHGFHLGEKQHYRKTTLWEPSTRIPLIVSGPGISTGEFDRPVGLLDMAPTVLDLAGTSQPAGWEGQTLLGITPVQADARPARTHQGGHVTVRWRTWRYIRYANGSEELYDLEADPHEFTNLASNPTYAAIKAQLAAMI